MIDPRIELKEIYDYIQANIDTKDKELFEKLVPLSNVPDHFDIYEYDRLEAINFLGYENYNDLAIEVSEKILSIDQEMKESSRFLYIYALLLLENSDYEKALDCLIKSLNIDNRQDYNTYKSHGHALFGLKRYKEALECFLRANDLFPPISDDNKFIYYNLLVNISNSYEKLDNINKALEWACKLYSISKEQIKSYNHLIYIYQKMGNISEANKLMQERVFYFNLLGIEVNFVHDTLRVKDFDFAKKLALNSIQLHSTGIPDSDIYQYKNVDKALEAIINNAIYLGDPNNFNDYTDPYYRLLNDKDLKNNYKHLMRNIGIACLSKHCNNVLLWSHYANSHKGVCIRYKIPNINRSTTTFCKVAYSKAKFIFQDDLILEKDNKVKQKSFVEQISTKSINWQYEEEYRIISWVGDDDKNRVLNTKIKAIYLGKEISDADEKTIINLIDKIDSNLPIYKMQTTDDNLWELEAIEITKTP